MSQKIESWKLVNKLIVSIEILLFWVTGLVVSSLYYSWDYVNFIYDKGSTTHFWTGFGVLTAVVIYSGLIIASLLTILLRTNDLVQFKHKIKKNKDKK